jgi:hypothetical protein
MLREALCLYSFSEKCSLLYLAISEYLEIIYEPNENGYLKL